MRWWGFVSSRSNSRAVTWCCESGNMVLRRAAGVQGRQESHYAGDGRGSPRAWYGAHSLCSASQQPCWLHCCTHTALCHWLDCTLLSLQLLVSTVMSAVLLAERNQMPCLSARPACFACHSAACLSAPCPRERRLSSGCPPSFCLLCPSFR